MLRRRPEPLAASLFFGALFGGAALMVGHGFLHTIAAPVLAASPVFAHIANGFAPLFFG
jgi:hypothetical protein